MDIDHQGSGRKLGRRTFLRMAAVGGGATLLAACGGTAPSSGESSVAASTGAGVDAGASAAASSAIVASAAPAGEQVTIEWANRFTTEVTQEVIPLMVTAFEEQNPNIKVEYQNPGVSEGYEEQMLARIAAGDAPDVMISINTPAEFAARGSLVDISDFMQGAEFAKPDAFYEGPLASCQWQGKTYGLPSSAGAGGIFTNVAKFKAKNVPVERDAFPKTWDELKALSAEFVVTEDGNVNEAGFIPFIGNPWLYPVWSALNGGQIFDANENKYTINTENNAEWLSYWLTWLDEQYGGNLESLNTAGQWGDAYNDGLFYAEKLAAVHSGSWAASDAEIPFEWEAVKFPVGPSGSKAVTGFYPNWWVIPTGAAHSPEAFRFIEFVSTRGWEIWYKYILDTPSWRSFPPDVLTDKLVELVGADKAKDVNAFFGSYLEDAIPMWNSPVETFAQETLGNSIAEVLNKVKSPQQALDEAQALCQAKLEEVVKS